MKGGAAALPNRDEKRRADELLKQAYEQYYTIVYRFCLSRLKQDRHSVEDCVQEAFIVLYNKYLSGENIEFVSAFLLQTASNFVKKRYAELEKANRQVDIEEIRHIPSQNQDLDDRLTFEEYSKQISAALSDTDAEIFSLRYIEEFKIEEIAVRMDMSIAAVTTRLSRMRNKLRDLLGDSLSR